MSVRTLIVGVLALVFGLSAVFGLVKFRESLAVAKPSEETVTVVVAAVDIPRGRIATADQFTTKQYPKSVAPKGAVASLEDAANRVPKDNLIAEEPVMEARLSPKGTSTGFANVIPAGMRAISIKTPNAATIGAGLILPGDKVDVTFTRRTQNDMRDTTGGGSSTLLVQMVEVLAINQRSDPQSDNKMDIKDLHTVTLLVTPEQMLQLELAQSLGILTLAQRSRGDTTVTVIGPYLAKDIQFHVGRPFLDQWKDASDVAAKAWETMQVEFRKTAKEHAERERVAKEKATKEETERVKAAKEETDRERKAELEQQRLEKLAQTQPKPVVIDQPSTPLRVRTIRSNVPGQVEVPPNGRQ